MCTFGRGWACDTKEAAMSDQMSDNGCRVLRGRAVVAGSAAGSAVVSAQPISLWAAWTPRRVRLLTVGTIVRVGT